MALEWKFSQNSAAQGLTSIFKRIIRANQIMVRLQTNFVSKFVTLSKRIIKAINVKDVRAA